MLAVAGSMAYAIGSQPLSRHDQDWNAALAAAEGGIDDYIFRLNENDQYYLYSATNLPPDGNQAFTTWVAVPNAATSAAMRYTVDTTNLTSQGAILLTATGRSGNRDKARAGHHPSALVHRLRLLHRLRDLRPRLLPDLGQHLHRRPGSGELRQALLRRTHSW